MSSVDDKAKGSDELMDLNVCWGGVGDSTGGGCCFGG